MYDQQLLLDPPASTDQPIPAPPAPPAKSKKGWLIGGAIIAGLFAIGSASGDTSTSTSFESPRTSSTSLSYTSSSTELDYVESSCRTALSASDGMGGTIGSGIRSGLVTRYQMATAFADGYVPTRSNSSLSYAEVVAACVEGLGG